MLLMCDEGSRPVFELKGSVFIGDTLEQPARRLVLKGETKLFFNIESELIRSLYESDALIVTRNF